MRKLNKKGYAALAVILGVFYLGGVAHYHSQFLPHTKILGTKISGKNTAQANRILEDGIKKESYTFYDKGKLVKSVSEKEVGIRSNFKEILKTELNKQNEWSWPLALFRNNAKDIPVSEVLINNQQLQSFSQAFTTTLNTKRTASVNANLALKDGQVQVTKEKYGNQVAAVLIDKQLKKNVAVNENRVDLDKLYIKPQIKTSDKAFKAAKAKMQKIAKVSGVIHLTNHKVTVSKNQVESWIVYQNGQVTLNQGAVTSYLNKLNDQYSTKGKDHKFKSTKHGTVTVTGGIYGWSVNVSKEYQRLNKAIMNGQSFNHQISYTGNGYHKNGTDIGDTYIEVDKQNQHEYYYKKGKLVMDSDVVTGNPNNNKETPTGVDYIWSKQQNATLRGKNINGTEYATKVAYWMPVDDTGVGLHDSPWQPKYGGDWYLTHGGHGCVNNPPDFIAKLYPKVALKTPVVIF